MFTFIITFRKSSGLVATIAILATSAQDAISTFMRQYDGRVISTEQSK